MSGLPWTGCSEWEITKHNLIQSYFRDTSELTPITEDEDSRAGRPGRFSDDVPLPPPSSSPRAFSPLPDLEEPSDNIAAVIDLTSDVEDDHNIDDNEDLARTSELTPITEDEDSWAVRPERLSDDVPLPPPSSSPRAYSPLPDLIIEKVRENPNKHDEPEEYYDKLEIKIKKYMKSLDRGNDRFSDLDSMTDEGSDLSQDLNSIEGQFTADHNSAPESNASSGPECFIEHVIWQEKGDDHIGQQFIADHHRIHRAPESKSSDDENLNEHLTWQEERDEQIDPTSDVEDDHNIDDNEDLARTSGQQFININPNEPNNSSSSETEEECEMTQEPRGPFIGQQTIESQQNEPKISSCSETEEECGISQEPRVAIIDQQLSKTHPNEPENSSSSEMEEENEVNQEPSENIAAVIESVSPQQRKRQADMQVQCDLKYKLGKFLLGDPVIYNLCKCKDHKCK